MKTYREFNASEWARLDTDWRAWWAGTLDRPLVVMRTIDPALERAATASFNLDYLADRGLDDFITQFPLDMPVGQVLDLCEPRLAATRHHGDAYPKWWVNFGAGVGAAFLGSAVEYRTRTTWFHPLTLDSPAGLHLRYEADQPWFHRVVEVTRAAVARWGEWVAIGMTDVGGNLDILASLRGTQTLLTDLYDDPDEVERLTREITALWLRWYDEFARLIEPAGHGVTCWAPPWMPGRGYMLQSDFCYMISPAMFERYVLPDLTACCAAMDYGFYHMDGKGQIPHLDMLLSIPGLRGIQWQPGAGAPLADEWLPLLRRIREGGKLCQVYVTRAGALKIARELGGRGFLFDVQEDDLTPALAEAFVEQLQREAG